MSKAIMSLNDQNNHLTAGQTKVGFLAWLETIQYIENDSNSIQDIVSVLSSALEIKDVRAIIRKGIKVHSKDMENESIISNIHKELESSQLTNKKAAEGCVQNKSNNNHKPLHNQVFRISDVACHIFKYLDTKSRLKCKNVNLLWLYNACNPASYYHLNIYDFICYKYEEFEYYDDYIYTGTQMFVRCEPELRNLITKSNGNIRKLTLCQWTKVNAKLFSSMVDKLTRLESIEIMEHEDEWCGTNEGYVFSEFFDENYPRVVLDLLSNNRESIKSIKIFNFHSDEVSAAMDQICEEMQNLLFPKLSFLTLDCPSEIPPVDISEPLWMNHSNLKVLDFIFYNKSWEEFFQDLTTNAVLLSNVETFKLHGCKATYDEIFALLIGKMKNIIHLDFNCDVPMDQWIFMLTKLPQASSIKSLTLQEEYHCRDRRWRFAADVSDAKRYDFSQLESLTVKADDVLRLKSVFKQMFEFKSNPISNIEQLTVACSANKLVSDLLGVYQPSTKSGPRKIFLPKLKYIKCKNISEKRYSNYILQAMKNISGWLDTREHHNCKVNAFDLGSEKNWCNHEFFKYNDYQADKNLSKFAQMFLEQLLSLNKSDNVVCTWRENKYGREYDFGVIVEKMKQLNMVSSSEVRHYTMISSTRDKPDTEFKCCGLFNQRLCFEQDHENIKIILKAKFT